MDRAATGKRPPRDVDRNARDPRRQDGGQQNNRKDRSRSPRRDNYRRSDRDRSDLGPGGPPTGPRNQRGGGGGNGQRPYNQRYRNDRGRGKYSGPGSRRGSASSSDPDKPEYSLFLEGSRHRQATKGGTTDLRYEELQPLEGPIDWEVDPDLLKRVIGITEFGSTKETHVRGNEFNYGVDRVKEIQARQFMNRDGGFNRALSPTRDRIVRPADLSGINR